MAVVLIPQSIAYAQLAGVPASYGLYGGIIPLIIYGVMGTSRQLGIGPVAISSILIFAGVSAVAEPFSDNYINLVILLGLLVGIVQWAMGAFKLGFLANFLSLPVLSGFISAAAIVIIISQLSTMMDIKIDKSSNALLNFIEELKHLHEAKWLPVLISLIAVLFIVLMRKVWKAFPSALLLVVIAALGMYFFNGEEAGLKVVGDVRSGLPMFLIPDISVADIGLLLPAVFTVALMGCVESLSIAKDLDLKQKQYRLDEDQELKAIGMSKIFGSLFQALPTSASFSRSAINLDSGAKTGLASIMTALFVTISLLFLTPSFYYIPTSILAAIIVGSVVKLIDIDYAVKLWRVSRKDWFMMITTFLVTLVGGIESGVLAGVVLSFGLVLFESSRPKIFELGRVQETDTFKNLKRFPSAEVSDRYQIVRFDERLYFANADYFLDRSMSYYATRKVKPQYFILDAGHINGIDITGLKALEKLNSQLCSDDVTLLIADAVGVLRDFFTKTEFYNKCEPACHFMSLIDAVNFAEQDDAFKWHKGAIQANV